MLLLGGEQDRKVSLRTTDLHEDKHKLIRMKQVEKKKPETENQDPKTFEHHLKHKSH